MSRTQEGLSPTMIRGRRIVEARRRSPRQFPEARVCDTCPTVLSRYNPGPSCNACDRRHRIERRGRTLHHWHYEALMTTGRPCHRDCDDGVDGEVCGCLP